MNKILETLAFYLHNFHSQDFILLGVCFLFFIVILILAIFLRHFAVFSIFLIIFAIFAEIALVIKGREYILQNYRQHELKIIKEQRLKYSNNIFLDFELHNKSKNTFKICQVEIRIQKPSKNRYQKIKNYLKPLKVVNITLKNIDANDYEKKKIIIPINVKKYKIKTNATCF